MASMSEQERLSKIVGGFDPETAPDLIAESLKSKIGTLNPDKVDQMRREILAAEGNGSKTDRYLRDYLNKANGVPTSQSQSNNQEAKPMAPVNSEALLIALYDIYDGLIDIFQRVGLNHEISDKLTNQIWNIEKCISKAGGEVNEFVPEDFVSGLEMPDLTESAERVVANTKRCYKLGSIEENNIEDNGNVIRLVFKGSIASGVSYKVLGVIKAGAKGWSGNEAIDYIYKSGGGKMSVRSYESGKWVNCSSDFNIKWELEENFPEDASKQEKPLNSKNNTSDDESDFEIVTKEV
jgi:hypothetical protein